MDDLLVSLSNGTKLVVPPSLAAITTYVLLEQETWFEKEFAFLEHLIEPGQTVIDIGANLGVYSLAMARGIGPTGRVFAYEPSSECRAKLCRSRELNAADQLTILDCALSDSAREGRLIFGKSSELNRLGAPEEGAGEGVQVSTLDHEAARLGWGQPHFVKIDAEGEEVAILRGGRSLLAESSPLLMLEFVEAGKVNADLRPFVEQLGYQTYRLLPGAPLLVPLEAEQDGFELNFFAAKPDRAAALEARGLLVQRLPELKVGEADSERAVAELRTQPFASAFPIPFAPKVAMHPEYRRALGAYRLWRDVDRPPVERVAALDLACRSLGALLQAGPQPAWLLTFARVAAEFGARVWALRALEMLQEAARGRSIPLREPFWPASARFEKLSPAAQPAQWLMAGIIEAAEQLGRHSTSFAPPSPGLDWLCSSPFASAAMLRRQALSAVANGRTLVVPPSLRRTSPDHLNAPLWDSDCVAELAKKNPMNLSRQASRRS